MPRGLNDPCFEQDACGVGMVCHMKGEKAHQIIADGLRTEFAKRTLKAVVSSEREEIMRVLSTRANETARPLGIEIIDEDAFRALLASHGAL